MKRSYFFELKKEWFKSNSFLGYCLFHHPLTIHGSFANESNWPRRATVVNLIADGVKSEADTPLLEGIPVSPFGEPLAGQFFPLLK